MSAAEAVPHVRWGGEQVHHLSDHDGSLNGQADKLTAESKLHRLARSDDCLAARKMLKGLEGQLVRKLVSGPK